MAEEKQNQADAKPEYRQREVAIDEEHWERHRQREITMREKILAWSTSSYVISSPRQLKIAEWVTDAAAELAEAVFVAYAREIANEEEFIIQVEEAASRELPRAFDLWESVTYAAVLAPSPHLVPDVTDDTSAYNEAYLQSLKTAIFGIAESKVMPILQKVILRRLRGEIKVTGHSAKLDATSLECAAPATDPEPAPRTAPLESEDARAAAVRANGTANWYSAACRQYYDREIEIRGTVDALAEKSNHLTWQERGSVMDAVVDAIAEFASAEFAWRAIFANQEWPDFDTVVQRTHSDFEMWIPEGAASLFKRVTSNPNLARRSEIAEYVSHSEVTERTRERIAPIARAVVRAFQTRRLRRDLPSEQIAAVLAELSKAKAELGSADVKPDGSAPAEHPPAQAATTTNPAAGHPGPETFGQFLTRKMRELVIDDVDVERRSRDGNKTGISRMHVGRLKNNGDVKRGPSSGTLRAIHDGTGISLKELAEHLPPKRPRRKNGGS